MRRETIPEPMLDWITKRTISVAVLAERLRLGRGEAVEDADRRPADGDRTGDLPEHEAEHGLGDAVLRADDRGRSRAAAREERCTSARTS